MTTLRTTLAAWMALALPLASLAETPSIGKDLDFRIKLTSALDSRKNQKGDKISAIVLAPAQFKGATMEGEIDEAKSSGRVNKTSTLKFTFSTLILANGDTVAVGSQVRSYTNSKGKEGVDEEGNLIEKKNNASKAGWGAAAGAGLGAMLGGAKGAAIGAAAGLVGSLIIVSVGTKAPAISFAPGSELALLVSDRRER